MRLGIAMLVFGYVLSQFYRAFLAVLSPALAQDLGVTSEDLALSSGLWFLAFACMQPAVGIALDTIGPRRTAAWLLGIGGAGGALVFGLAQGAWSIHLAMILIGIGCSPVLMASYYIFARTYPPAVFATLAGALVGLGTLGNVASAWPLAVTAEALGWRGTVLGVGVVTLMVALSFAALVKDPPPTDKSEGGGSIFDLLRMPALWLIVPMMLVNYAPAAGIRGLWVGPYYVDVYGADAEMIGRVALVMAFAMILGNFVYGPLDRVFGSRKWVVLGGNTVVVGCLLTLWAMPAGGFWTTALLLAAIGFFGASFPLVMAHGRSLFPPHLVGRGVTLLNLFGIGGVGLMQLLSGRLHVAASAEAATPSDPYAAIFLFFALFVIAGSLIYAFSRDRTD